MRNRTSIQEKVWELFSLSERRKTPRGWYSSPEPCPFCGKANHHFGILLKKKTQKHPNEVTFNCFKCQSSGGEFLLFKKLGLTSLLKSGVYIKEEEAKKKISLYSDNSEDEDLNDLLKERKLPLGFERVFENAYLESRGFEPWQYEQYVIGETYLDFKMKDRIIFLIKDQGINRGYVARITWDKDRIRRYEESSGKKVIRYKNESGVDFSRLLFGIDEVSEKTVRVILVEGITDKANIDRFIRKMNFSSLWVCICTFGKKFSEQQIIRLKKQSSNIQLVFLYDSDAIEESKSHALNARSYFSEILIGFLKEKDPGDITIVEFQKILEKLEDPINFIAGKVQKRIL